MLELPVNDEQRQRLWHIKVASLRACKIIKDNIENLISLIKLQRPSIYDIKLTKEKKLLKEVSFFLWCFSIVDSSSVSHTNLISFFFFLLFQFLFFSFLAFCWLWHEVANFSLLFMPGVWINKIFTHHLVNPRRKWREISDPFFNTEGKKLREKMGR